MNFSICYITNRHQPQFQWFVDSLCRQVGSDTFPEIIFIDSVLWEKGGERRTELAAIVAGRFPYRHEAPKPCVWCGPTRLTQRNYFAAANTRNTGACYASRDYIFFVDDLSVLMGDWLKEARHAAQHRYVVGGAYKKAFEMVVEGGELKSARFTAGGTDSRWGIGSVGGIVPIGGGQLYGCSFGIPMHRFLEVNGQDEACDSMGGEDYYLGLSLEKLGVPIFYNINLYSVESEEGHGQGPVFLRLDKGLGQSSLDHLAKKRQHGPRAMGNNFNLAEIRRNVLNGGGFPVPVEPSLHWWDNQPLSEL